MIFILFYFFFFAVHYFHCQNCSNVHKYGTYYVNVTFGILNCMGVVSMKQKMFNVVAKRKKKKNIQRMNYVSLAITQQCGMT